MLDLALYFSLVEATPGVAKRRRHLFEAYTPFFRSTLSVSYSWLWASLKTVCTAFPFQAVNAVGDHLLSLSSTFNDGHLAICSF